MGVGRSNSTEIVCPVNIATISLCRICSPLKMEGNTISVFSFPAPNITIVDTVPSGLKRFCPGVGINLLFGKKVKVANLLPAIVIAVAAAFLPV